MANPTAALNVTLGRLIAEYFGIAESLGVSPAGQPSTLFWNAVGRLASQTAKHMIDSGDERPEGTLVDEYLKDVREGAFRKNLSAEPTRLN